MIKIWTSQRQALKREYRYLSLCCLYPCNLVQPTRSCSQAKQSGQREAERHCNLDSEHTTSLYKGATFDIWLRKSSPSDISFRTINKPQRLEEKDEAWLPLQMTNKTDDAANTGETFMPRTFNIKATSLPVMLIQSYSSLSNIWGRLVCYSCLTGMANHSN